MAAAAKVAGAAHGHLKIKLGAGGDDLARLRAIRDAVPDARLIADVNEAWTIDMLVASLPELAALGIEMLEQPLPAGQDAALAEIDRLVPIGADESCHRSEEHTSELQSLMRISYAVFCLKQKKEQ